MVYSGATAILGRGSVTPANIQAWMAQIGRAMAPGFASDGQYHPPPDTLGQVIINWCRYWPDREVNYDMVAGQIAHETAGWQAYWAREHDNPAGLGVTGVPGAGERFPSHIEGVECQVAHLLSYAVGRGAWVAHDCRAAGFPAAFWGSAPLWRDLGGKWAVPGTTYGQQVADMANDLVQFSGAAQFEMPSSINGIPLRKSFIPLENRNRPGTPATAEGRRWVTVHETANPGVGANAEMHRRYVHAGGGMGGDNDGVSFTFVVDDKEIIWLLPLEEKSWQASDGANGAGNSSASIEACVNADGNWSVTKEHLAQLVAYLATNAPGRSVERIAQHNHWARDKKNCPMKLRANNGAEWNALLTRIHQIANEGASPPRPEGPLVLPGNPYGEIPVIGGFKDYIEDLGEHRYAADPTAGILSIFGYPLAAEEATDFGAEQKFERAILLWHRANPPPWDICLMLRSDHPSTKAG